MKKLFTKITITILTTTLFMCGSFFINTNFIHADTAVIIDGVDTGAVEGVENGLTYVLKNGVKYFLPRWASQNVESQTTWKRVVATQVLTADAVLNLGQAVNNFNGLDDIVGDYAGKIKTGWDSIINSFDKSTLTYKGVDLIKGLLGARDFVQDTYGSFSSALSNAIDSVQESANRRYYDLANTIDNTLSYNHGATSYYSVYNPVTSTFYNTYSNTYETVNNYDYDIENNYYNYYTTENHYHVSNNYNYTYVFNTTSNLDYELYYQLPNGDNSYNLTEADINGIRTDFSVDNYQVNSSNPNLHSIYHFNNTMFDELDNSSISSDSQILNYTNYVDSYPGFNNALALTNLVKHNKAYSSRPFYNLFNLNNSYNGIKFIIKPSVSVNTVESYLFFSNNSFPNSNTQLFSTSISNDKINITNYDNLPMIQLSNENFNFIDISNNHVYLNGSDTGYVFIGSGLTKDDFLIRGSSRAVASVTESTDYYTIVDTDGMSRRVYKTNFSHISLLSTSTNLTYVLLDELIISNNGFTNHDNSVIELENTNFFTLPSVDTNNKLLIKSAINVTDFQFGGIRKGVFDSTKGDVYINLVDGVINSIQQFNGTYWVAVDGAIYSESLAKWVNAIGYSIYLNDFSYSDIMSDNVDDISSFSSFFSRFIGSISDSIDGALSDIKSLLHSILLNSSSTVVDDSESIDLSDYMDNVNSADNDIDISDSQNELVEKVPFLTTFLQPLNTIYDSISDNGLSYLFVAPIILYVVRLVI